MAGVFAAGALTFVLETAGAAGLVGLVGAENFGAGFATDFVAGFAGTALVLCAADLGAVFNFPLGAGAALEATCFL